MADRHRMAPEPFLETGDPLDPLGARAEKGSQRNFPRRSHGVRAGYGYRQRNAQKSRQSDQCNADTGLQHAGVMPIDLRFEHLAAISVLWSNIRYIRVSLD
ncbi:hypothetical protein GCM10010468_45830 [Actinocorallia longicatena]|uniref:Transposase n=1 Tax=Actinocorallia longicatena TaxID=111803 RepID=A0ABP6QDH5_9ACTN